MKRRLRPILLSALAVLLFLTWGIFRVVHQEQLNNALIAALIDNDLDKAHAALKAGAEGNARYNVYGFPRSPIELLKKLLPHARAPVDQQQPALLLYLERQQPVISLSGHTRGRGKDDPILVKALLDAGADINAQDVSSGSNWTPMRLAARASLSQTVRLLAARGANVNDKDASGQTPLTDAVRYGDAEAVQVLIEAGAEINAADSEKFTPLHYACMEGHLAAAYLLIQHHADLNLQTSDGMSPLHWAAFAGHKPLVEAMLRQHPNLNLRNRAGMTALDLAIMSFGELLEHPTPAMISKHEIIPLLQKAGAKTGKELSGKSH